MVTSMSTRGNGQTLHLGESSVTGSLNGDTTNNASPDYKIVTQPRKFFKKGRMFMACWVEPAGYGQSSGEAGRGSFSENRHFMVVRSKPGHCLCLSVHTYGQQATTKHGVWPDEHASVIPYGGFEVLAPGESSLNRQPIQVILENKTVVIDASSRADFSRVYTFEYNVPVRNIGRALPADLPKVEAYLAKSISILPGEQFEAEEADLPQRPLRVDHVWNSETSYNATSDFHSTIWEWFYKLPQYQKWRISRHSLLWIGGTSQLKGSTLSEQLIDHELQDEARRAVCYFRLETDNNGKNNWTTALHSLLLQLLAQRPTLAKYLEYPRMTQQNNKTSSSLTLWAIFLTIVEQASENIICVLSGLNEGYSGQESCEIINRIRSLYCTSSGESEKKVELSLVITSQPDTDHGFQSSDFICPLPTGETQPKGETEENYVARIAYYEPAHDRDSGLEHNARDIAVRPYAPSALLGLERGRKCHYDEEPETVDKNPGSKYPFPSIFEENTVHKTRNPSQTADQRNHSFSSTHFRCTYPGCSRAFNRASDLNRHRLDKHNSRSFSCKFSGCDRRDVKAFDRADKLRHHLRERHRFRVQEDSIIQDR